jgi:hypothetical protein
MQRRTYVIGVAVLLAALLTFSGVAQSAMWVGAELGGNLATGSEVKFNGVLQGGVHFHGSVIGGAAMGYDFVNSGIGGRAWPDWMKYFSVATDITYNKLSVHSLGGVLVDELIPFKAIDGYCVAWTFLFMAHYGFFPDSEIPAGRVNPYIGVGPAIIWSGLNVGGVSGASTNVALVVEPGVRWVVLQNVSIDTSFRYRLVRPDYTFNQLDMTIQPLHQCSFLVRANYHF